MPQYNRSPEQWAETLAQYRAKGLAPESAEILDWAYQYMAQECGLDYGRLAAECHYDQIVIYKVFLGSYEASLDGVLEALAAARKRLSHSVGFVETPITQRIFEALDYCADMRALVTICGETGRSKTTALLEWQRRNNHGKSVYVRCTSGATRGSLIRQVCKAVGIGTAQTKILELEPRLFKILGRKVLILDEAGHLLPAARARRAAEPLELVRDLHDVCGCGVCLCMTDVYLQELRHGAHAAWFEQFLGRVKYSVPIPRTIFAEEVAALVSAYVAKPAAELLSAAGRIARQEGKLRTLCDDLAKARKFAERKGQTLAAAHLILARRWRESGGSFDDLHPVAG